MPKNKLTSEKKRLLTVTYGMDNSAIIDFIIITDIIDNSVFTFLSSEIDPF